MGDYSLLGNAQTFIGALFTLAVLCLFYDRNNFFNSFLGHLKEEVNETFNNIISRIHNISEDKWEKDNRFFCKVLDSQQNELESEEKKTEYSQLRQEFYKVSTEISMSKVRFKVDNEGTRAKAYDIMGAVESAKEFGFVALYSFLFCGLVLSLDCFFIKESEFLLIFLHIFTISSFAFMFLFWKHLWSKVKSDNNKEIPEFMSHMDTRFSFVVLFFFVFLPLIFLIVMELLPVLKYRYWICLGVIFLIFLLAYYFGSKQKFRTIINTCNYNSLFMFSHFLYLLIGSLFISFIYYESLTCIQKYNTSIFFDQKNTIKYLICTFAITNAVFIPFFLSFFRYKIVWVRFCFKIKKKEKEKDKSVRKLEKEYGEIIEKIKNLVIENTSK